MPRRYPDIAKIEAAIAWAPTRSLDEILGDVVSFQQAEAAVV
jgi:nucleoside-diphosphate-sugar epimerase